MPLSRYLYIIILVMILLVQHSFTSVSGDSSSSSTSDGKSKPDTWGAQRVIVVLIEFEDVGHRKAKNEVANAVFGDLNRYVTEVSYNTTWITGAVTDWIRLPYEISYYGRDFMLGIDCEVRKLFSDSVHAVDSFVDFRSYRHIMIVHAGKGQETSGALSDLWSSYYNFRSPVYADGLILNNAIIVPEEQADNKGILGVYAHEFMHSLGLPDLYPAFGLNSKYVGLWDVMDAGFRNGKPPGSSPPHPSAWSKLTLGWPINTRTIYAGSVETLTISPFEVATKEVQVVMLPVTPGRYYLVEVRQQLGFDKPLPDQGILITYVDEKLPTQSGMVRVVDSTPSAPDLQSATFKAGQTFSDSSKLIRLSVVFEKGSYKLHIDRRIPQ